MTPEQQIDAIVRATFDDLGGLIVTDVQSRISEAYPPPSAPGESPHRRSGTLQEGIIYEVAQAGPITLLTVLSTAPYSIFLEEGTIRMKGPRPFMGPARDDWAPAVHQRLSAAFSTSAGSAVLAASNGELSNLFGIDLI